MAEGLALHAEGEPRHGFLVGDVHVLIPRAIRSQYLPRTSVFPVPRATPRLRGLVAWRGQAVVAIDAADPPSPELPVIGVCNLLLMGPDSDAIGLLQSAPPRVVQLTDAATNEMEKPSCWLSRALTDSRIDASKQVWWELDLAVIAQCMHSAQLDEEPAQENHND